ncbi:TNT domain-containing protein [Breznakia pachnodae]|uniref:TNT domain-containing protein n=1 Tax=Breznakia pachnodae TaxID=265178 RepID=A0ABU0E609_9FIRM|nr:TNT domain-containing protein [Breznakia pachnodae]MDQ0362149.1 hypothetical protein [Breznakia pachnodae]
MNKKIDLNGLSFISYVATDLDAHLDDLISVNTIIADVGSFIEYQGLQYELGYSYSNQKKKLNTLSDDIETFANAATTGSNNNHANSKSVADILYACVEHPFYLSLDDTIERLSKVEIDEYEVKNTNGIVSKKESWNQIGYRDYERVLNSVTYDNLNINDILKSQYSRDRMRGNYERYLQALYPDIKDISAIDADMFYESYLASMLILADFDHTTLLENSLNILRTTGAVLAFGTLFFTALPGAATFLGVNVGGLSIASGIVNGGLSVVDALCLFNGTDINGNPLTPSERDALMATVTIDGVFLSISVAGKIRYNASKTANADTAFDVAKTADDIKYQQWLEYANLGVDQQTRMKLMDWSITPSPDLYIKYKEVYDNSKFFNQKTGSVIYPGTNGDVNLYGFINGQYEIETLQTGKIIDRYGSRDGYYLSPEGTPYESRALAPFMDGQPYARYEVIVPFDVKSGTVAPWFNQKGGGIQFLTDYTVNELIDLGWIKELK